VKGQYLEYDSTNTGRVGQSGELSVMEKHFGKGQSKEQGSNFMALLIRPHSIFSIYATG